MWPFYTTQNKNDDQNSSESNDDSIKIESKRSFITDWGKQLYVITIDSNPRCYAESIEDARGAMMDIAWDLTKLDSDWKYSVVDECNIIKVTRRRMCALFSYDEIVHVLRVSSISPVSEKSD